MSCDANSNDSGKRNATGVADGERSCDADIDSDSQQSIDAERNLHRHGHLERLSDRIGDHGAFCDTDRTVESDRPVQRHGDVDRLEHGCAIHDDDREPAAQRDSNRDATPRQRVADAWSDVVAEALAVGVAVRDAVAIGDDV